MRSTDLPRPALRTALQLVASVHDYDHIAVTEALNQAGRHELYAMCVSLAAMVDPDQHIRDLLAWNDDAPNTPPAPAEAARFNPRILSPHGTHSAYARHKKRGEQPCAECIEGERTYQRLRQRRRRGQVAS